jgi:hypothetical protein
MLVVHRILCVEVQTLLDVEELIVGWIIREADGFVKLGLQNLL